MNTILARLMRAMINYDCGDVPRIQHFVKVHNFAATIGIAENLDEDTLFILEAAAILHDIGIHPAEAKYGNSNGKAQEELGPDEARNVLSEVGGFTDAQTERICWLIGHHHTYTDVKDIDHRILLEADFLVNSYEDNIPTDGIIAFRKNVFRSASAIEMLNKMWNLMKKIAIPTRDNVVDDHFGHCDHYTVFTIDAENNIVSSERLDSPQGCGCKSNIASVMQEMGITLMLAGNMGMGAFNKLTEHGISVVRGCHGNIEEVLKAYLNGNITDSAESCSHHDCESHEE